MQPWEDTTSSSPERVSALLAAMTPEEKVAQLTGAWIGFSPDPEHAGNDVRGTTGTGDTQVSPFQDAFEEVPWERARRQGLGHLTRPFGTAPLPTAAGVANLVAMQRDLMSLTRLGIPAIAHEECLTGFTTLGATIYPTPLALAATFDPTVAHAVAERIGADLAAVGVHQGLAPVLDVVRDYRWGRVEETFGEDPYLVAMVGSSYVRGLQASGVVATLKHFVGYSASRAARNHAPVSMGLRELRDVLLPPFEMAIRLGGARSVMNAYNDIDGVPVAADRRLLVDVLRTELGFTGVTVSDYWAVSLLSDVHGVAGSPSEAAALALTSGLDVELPSARCYDAGLVELVRDGQVAQDVLDDAVRRVLTQKLDHGLLDDGYDPAAGVEEQRDLDSPENRAVAADAAERSVVLLANDGTLPLPATARVAVVGPCADEPRSFLGCYSYPNHVLHRFPELGLGVEVDSVLAGLRAQLSGADVSYARGCSVRGLETDEIAAAVRVAAAADVAVVVIGDLAGLFGLGTSGEGCDAPDLRLPGVQHQLVEAVLATGVPVVLVCVTGRPYALGGLAERAAAVVQAFMPGEEGGHAIAGVLSGRVNPSGRLPVQIPATAHAQPSTYLQPAYGRPGLTASVLEPTVLYPFGHGLSYTTFDVGDLVLHDVRIPTDGALSASVRVTNTGGRAGAETVQLYLHDPVAEVARPVSTLIGFAKVELQPGETTTVTFEISTDRFAYHGRDGVRIVDPGVVELRIGRSCDDVVASGAVELIGPARRVGADRRLTTPVSVGTPARRTTVSV